MSSTKHPYNPDPQREDAFGELAEQGFAGVAGDHAAALDRLQRRAGVPTEASVKRLAPRWLAPVAAAAAILLLVLIYVSYSGEPTPYAANTATEATETIDVTNDAAPQVQQASPPEQEQSRVLEALDVEASDEIVSEARPAPSPQHPAPSTQHPAPSPQPPAPSPQHPAPSTQPPPDHNIVVRPAPSDATGDHDSEEHAVADELKKVQAAPATAPTASAPQDSRNQAARKRAAEPASASSYSMERDDRGPTERTVTGTLRSISGELLPGATVLVEETGQLVEVDLYGNFLLELPAGARVGLVEDARGNQLRFDLTAGDAFDLRLAEAGHQLSRVRLQGRTGTLGIVAPVAARYAAFDAYVAEQSPAIKGEVVVQFEINRHGQPQFVVAGPGEQSRELVKQAKDLLLTGPEWPEAYRRKAWRYAIDFGLRR